MAPGKKTCLPIAAASSRQRGLRTGEVGIRGRLYFSLSPTGCFVWVFGTQGLRALAPPAVLGTPGVSVPHSWRRWRRRGQRDLTTTAYRMDAHLW
jgi:hypothetical protein